MARTIQLFFLAVAVSSAASVGAADWRHTASAAPVHTARRLQDSSVGTCECSCCYGSVCTDQHTYYLDTPGEVCSDSACDEKFGTCASPNDVPSETQPPFVPSDPPSPSDTSDPSSPDVPDLPPAGSLSPSIAPDLGADSPSPDSSSPSEDVPSPESSPPSEDTVSTDFSPPPPRSPPLARSFPPAFPTTAATLSSGGSPTFTSIAVPFHTRLACAPLAAVVLVLAALLL